MAGEIVDGKRTFLQRPGRPAYELPDRHTAELVDYGSTYGRVVILNAPLAGAGQYAVDDLEDLTTALWLTWARR